MSAVPPPTACAASDCGGAQRRDTTQGRRDGGRFRPKLVVKTFFRGGAQHMTEERARHRFLRLWGNFSPQQFPW